MIVLRSDSMPVYNMAVVADDHEMGITHVLRGDDHVPNTYRQILLYQAMNLPLPRFAHVPMILGPDRQKLSKRHGARSVIEYERDGFLPQALINCLVRLGWSHGDQEIFSLEELVRYFDGSNLSSASAAFDPEKLQWLNANYLRETPVGKLAHLVASFVEVAVPPERILELVPLYRERAANLVELAKNMRPLLCTAQNLEYDPKAVAVALNDEGKTQIAALRPLLAAATDFSAPALERCIHAYIENNGLTFKKVAPPLRVALTGLSGGPSLPDILQALGRAESLARLDKAFSL
jgi:glutamyl-tRNA synthetase